MIDLHTHSTASDGTLSPEALTDLAAQKGLTALALTDHDTVAGIPGARKRGAHHGLEVIPGVELGVEWEGSGTMHILGYYFRYDDAELEKTLAELRQRRRERAQAIVAKLNQLGCKVSFGRVEEIAGGESTLRRFDFRSPSRAKGEGQSSGWPERKSRAIGRPHLARALVEAGAVKSVAQGFQRYLAKGKPAFVEKVQLNPAEAIKLLKSCGGAAVLAHPATLRVGKKSLARCLEDLMGYGLDGLEVMWSGHNPAQVESFTALAQRLGLLMMGGSDFHGENKPGVELGTGREGNVQVPDSFLERLRRGGQPG